MVNIVNQKLNHRGQQKVMEGTVAEETIVKGAVNKKWEVD